MLSNFYRFLCTTAPNRAEKVLFRSYPHELNCTSSVVNRTLKEHRSEATISLTTCATSAAPTYFPEVKWKNLVFWDRGLLNNNPVDQLWAARYDLVEPNDPKISYVLSLGYGYMKAGSRVIDKVYIKRMNCYNSNYNITYLDYNTSY